MPTLTLAHTQQLVWQLITAPDGVAGGLARLTSAQRATAQSFVRGDARLSAAERLDIYADMYFYRIRDCLKEDFVAVAGTVGDTNFHNLITDYLIAHPPAHFSLRYAGQALPSFLGAHPLVRRWPYLADLAALEWAITEAFDAADEEPVAAAALAAVAQERWPDMRFRVSPSLRLLDLGWPVHEIWRQAQEGGAGDLPTASPTALRVWRQDLRVFHHAIDPTERAALGALAAGAPFAEVCEQLPAAAGETVGAERAFALLGGWLADGLLVGYAFE